ncbi:membrane lipoprotein lipid attachment site-containing protein [Pasteurella oralis]|uniref:Type IV secretion system putative lipoprotein virB7 n=1 Tax=Pasteurella oralis TaxID=1071947 RepID=A0ABW4NTF0_9PAST
MQKILFILTALFALSSCEQNIETTIEQTCIDGVVYLVYQDGEQRGITPKVNADYLPYTCVMPCPNLSNQKKERNNDKTCD